MQFFPIVGEFYLHNYASHKKDKKKTALYLIKVRLYFSLF